VNQYQTAQDFPNDYPPLRDGDKKWSRGGSSIVSPLGIVLAGPLWDKEGIITAEVCLADHAGIVKLTIDRFG
jgi:predicted amidohydrolase